MNSKEWAGFTDEDIQKIQSNSEPKSSLCNNTSCSIDAVPPAIETRRPMKIKKIHKPSINTEESSDASQKTVNVDVCRMEKPEKSTVRVTEEKLLKSASENDIKYSSSLRCDDAESVAVNGHNDTMLITKSSSTSSVRETSENESNFELNSSHSSLEIFEQRQKRIEAENARRRALIIKTIMDKQKRTRAEVFKLAKVQEELDHLDSLLSSDIYILRNCIEKASMEFTEAEKRYLKAEKEFVEAKLLLFDKMQRKEQLTEHLCTIIEQNEARKADKLLELMKQLEMESENENCQDQSNPILPNLCILNDEAYHYQTLVLSQAKKDVNSSHQEKVAFKQDTNANPFKNEKTEKQVKYELLPAEECAPEVKIDTTEPEKDCLVKGT